MLIEANLNKFGRRGDLRRLEETRRLRRPGDGEIV
jgi:hypothetical protein